MANRGLLMVIAEPPVAMEEEFNAWFDTEHFPERMSVKGFMTGRRFVSCDRMQRYLVLYDLAEVGVLHSDDYRAHTGDNLTPWSRRILARQRSTRHEASQIFPGEALLVPSPRHLLLQFNGLDEGAVRRLRDWIADGTTIQPGVAQRRLFAITSAAAGTYLMIISGTGALAQTLDLAALGDAADRVTLMETFAPY